MAALLLGAAASALVGATGATGLVASAIMGAATLGGSLIDSYLFGAKGGGGHAEGQRLDTLHVLSSTEGAPVPLIAGWARVSGQVIWATKLEEEVRTSESRGGGKGRGGGGVSTTEYFYFANFAVGICEGPISKVLRVWADGRELDMTSVPMRVYRGTEDQLPDGLIEERQGAGKAPAYRGLAYVVFERLPLADYGNRVPQLTFEIVRSVGYEEERLTGVCLIPGATEFGYSPDLVRDRTSGESLVDNNRHTNVAASDWTHSLDLLQAVAPNVQSVSLVVSWFGTDLRCGACRIEPRIEAVKQTEPVSWRVAGLDRSSATLVSQVDGKPAFGGSPDDVSVIKAIRDLKARGLTVMLYPFIMMDVPAANGLPDPYGRAQQPVYPWRGRITCHPAPGQPDTPDKTANAAGQVSAFLGTAQASDFGSVGDAVLYSGPEEWGYRRFVLHLAKLAQVAGGVDAFCLGSEMPGMTSVRAAGNAFPFVEGLCQLAGEVRALLGGSVKLGYAADWSEYHSHRPADGSGDVFFNLDPLWSHPQIDFIGIDSYLPLSDWRDTEGHADHLAGHAAIHDLDYLKANIEGGEHFDWFYASTADRDAQNRRPIADTGYGEDWIFRQKDIRSWWSNAHHDRPGGARSGSATAFVPEGKPVWFTEFGCPAIDKGANQPHVFYDPKSSESIVPYYSTGARDDLIQRRYLRAMLDYWAPSAGHNPVSAVYGGHMLDVAKFFAWAWDVRPFPSFPVEASAWADHANFTTGHWLSGRLGGAPADGVARLMLQRSGMVEGRDFETSGFDGVADGYMISDVISARTVLETLGAAFFFDPLESGGHIVARSRRSRLPVKALDASGLVDQGEDREPVKVTRAQQTELPRVVRLTAYDSTRDFKTVTGEALHDAVSSDRVIVTDLPIVSDFARVQAAAESLLLEAWSGMERFDFSVPPSALALEPGDVVTVARAGRVHPVRMTGIRDGAARAVMAKSYEAPVYEPGRGLGRVDQSARRKVTAPVLPVYIDGPLLQDNDDAARGYVSAYKLPFRPGVVFYSSPSDSGFVLRAAMTTPGTIGTLKTALAPGPLYRWDRGNTVTVELLSATLASLEEPLVLGGGNAVLVQAPSGVWELLQFQRADLIGERTYRLSNLLRGQRGTENAMGAQAGARAVFLSGAIVQPNISRDLLGVPLTWQSGAAGDPVGAEGFRHDTVTFTGRAARPLSPCHLAAVALEGGDIRLSWIRRTRIGGDAWDAPSAPLGEEVEAYEVEIWQGGALRRMISATSEAMIYAAADQVADLGAVGLAFDFQVFQLSALVGRGDKAEGRFQP